MDDVQTKSFGPLTVKSAETGEVEAVVATIGVVDRDGDVILPGAIAVPNRVMLSEYEHDIVLKRAAPVGVGSITEEGGRVILRGRFFLETARGREAFATVKALGDDGRWSFGFPNATARTATLTPELRVQGARRVLSWIDPMEASPVFRAAGHGTGTVATKAETTEISAEVKRFEGTVKRAETPPDVPLPARFNAFADWLADRFALTSSERPAIKMVLRSRLPDGATGQYIRERGEILVAADLDDETTRAVLVHEHAHHYEATKGWTQASEGFALKMERELLRRWHHEQRGAR
jgi:hypothetical protein